MASKAQFNGTGRRGPWILGGGDRDGDEDGRDGGWIVDGGLVRRWAILKISCERARRKVKGEGTEG